MVGWAHAGAAPELAAKGLARFDATGLSLIGTVRRDGSPRSAQWSRSSPKASWRSG